MNFLVVVEERAIKDIQVAIDYYESKQSKLGLKFKNAIDSEFTAIAKNPFYQLRYDYIRCKPIKKFPYLIHFSVDERNCIVYVFAVICTYLNPETAWLKR